jgi:predicted esterase
MIRRCFYTQVLLGLSVVLAACGSDGKSSAKPQSLSCDDGETGQDCSENCDDGETGKTICENGELVCECAAAEDEPTPGKKDAGKTPAKDASVGSGSKDASKPAKADAATDDQAGEDASTPPTPEPSLGGKEPKIPEITGECPDLKTGTATIGGLSGIKLEVGAKKSGGALLFYWHGTGSTSSEYLGMVPGSVRNEILSGGGIIVSPQGKTGKGSDCSGTGTFSQGDFEVSDLIAACAVKNHGIDPRKIYTTGCSAGGLQATCMAQMRSSYIAAAAPNSGGLTFPMGFQDKSHTPALMTMHGGSSDMVIIQFSQSSKTADNAFKTAGGFVINCNHGGGHCAAPAAAYTSAWEFMKAHPFGVDPKPYTEVPSSFPDYCKIF